MELENRQPAGVAREWAPPGGGSPRTLVTGPDPGAAVGWPATFAPLDSRLPRQWPTLAELRAGRICLLGTDRSLGDPPDWLQTGAPALWRFHLHYWDWAWALAADTDREAARAVFARLWRSWHAMVRVGRQDAWLAYPAALRAWSWCGLHRDLVAGSELAQAFVAELAGHIGFLRRDSASGTSGSHLIKDLKALVGLAVFFTDERLLRRAVGRLTARLAVQVLPDGGHCERAPAYHCQVLGDLIDVADLLASAGHPPEAALTQAIARMRHWLGGVLAPDGQVPLLGGGYPVAPELIAALAPGQPPAGPLLTLPDTGLVRAAVGGWHLLADVGATGRGELPGPAHADTLGCLVHVDGAPLLVDAGTSTSTSTSTCTPTCTPISVPAPGPVRGHERTTAARNTVEIDGVGSTQTRGAFRAARRARARGLQTSGAATLVTIEAERLFGRLSGRPAHRRRWSVSASGLQVEDLVTGRGRHAVTARWQLAPGSAVQLDAGGALITTPAGAFLVSVAASGVVKLTVESAQLAAGFLRTTVAPVLACRIEAVLPVRLTTCWRKARDWSVPGAAGAAARAWPSGAWPSGAWPPAWPSGTWPR